MVPQSIGQQRGLSRVLAASDQFLSSFRSSGLSRSAWSTFLLARKLMRCPMVGRATCLQTAVLGFLAVMMSGCGGGSSASHSIPNPACVPASAPAFAYVLNGGDNTVSIYTVNSCTGDLSPTTPATVATGANNFGSEQMVVDPAGRFAYVANLMSNASDEATISMYTINAGTGVLTPTTPATVPTGFFPQGIAIDPSGKFVYTANSDDNSVSMFTISQTTGVLTPTTPLWLTSRLGFTRARMP